MAQPDLVPQHNVELAREPEADEMRGGVFFRLQRPLPHATVRGRNEPESARQPGIGPHALTGANGRGAHHLVRRRVKDVSRSPAAHSREEAAARGAEGGVRALCQAASRACPD